jgi:NAD(P)-dependent dehydrogenase (short-subunit alcohol dehydrogenase family)
MATALITGGGSLIGEGIARSLVRDGWNVVVSDLKPELAEKVTGGLGPAATPVRLDVTDRDAAVALCTRLAGENRLDALVNVAGGGRGLGVPKADFLDHTPGHWDKLIGVNFRGLLNVTHAALGHMVGRGRGAIVSTAAARGLKGGPQAAIYSGLKAAIIVFSQSLAQEVGRHGVRVNSVAPGNTEARWKNTDPDAVRSPLGSPTTADDVGDAVAFLLSDKARHVTGACLDVSGGTALH